MGAMVPGDAEPDFDLLTAALRADARDLKVFMESLAIKLEEAIPGHVRVERRRAGLFGAKAVARIVVDIGDQRLELHVGASALQPRLAKLSGGIVLKSEPLEIDAWLQALARALAAEAGQSETTRRALARLLTE